MNSRVPKVDNHFTIQLYDGYKCILDKTPPNLQTDFSRAYVRFVTIHALLLTTSTLYIYFFYYYYFMCIYIWAYVLRGIQGI